MLKFIGGMTVFLLLTGILLLVAGGVFVGLLPRYAPPYVERLIAEKAAAYGLNPSTRMRLAYRWNGGPVVDGSLRIALPESPWCVKVRFNATRKGWTATADLPETAFDQNDRILKGFGDRFVPPTVSNLTYSGTIALSAQARGGYLWDAPVWSARLPIRNLSADFFSGKKSVSLRGLSLAPAVTGVVSHVDIRPTFVRADALTVNTIALTNLHASVHASERALLLTEAGAGFCGGTVTLYSLFLNMKNLNTGFTLFADEIEAGEAMRHFNGFHGDASGRLHGKIRLFVQSGGREIKLSDAYLYSTPGETGNLRLEESEAVLENLAYAGLDADTRANVANALTDLDYSALKLSLRRDGGKTATLTTHINGTATRGQTTVPVNLTLNFHGDIEQLINLSLDYSNKMKGKKK